MGVKVKLADAREVGTRKYQAGDVVDVEPGEARVLVAVGAGVRVDARTAATPAPQVGATPASAPKQSGETGRKG